MELLRLGISRLVVAASEIGLVVLDSTSFEGTGLREILPDLRGTGEGELESVEKVDLRKDWLRAGAAGGGGKTGATPILDVDAAETEGDIAVPAAEAPESAKSVASGNSAALRLCVSSRSRKLFSPPVAEVVDAEAPLAPSKLSCSSFFGSTMESVLTAS